MTHDGDSNELQPHPGRPAGLRGEPDQLRLLFWETTAACNLSCRHCRRLDLAAGGLAPGDLDTAACLKLVDQLASFARPILVLSGGEPLLRPDLFRIAARAREQGLPVALATNGTLIGPALARQIVDSGVRRVSISLDGATAAVHDAFRGLPGSFERALEGFQHLCALGMSLQVNCTVARHNQHQLEEVHALAKRIGAEALHFFMLVPVGCGVELSASQQLEPRRYEEILGWIYDRQQQDPALQLKATCAPHYFRILHQRGGSRGGASADGMHTLTRGCLAGSAVCFVSHTGEVFPCGYLPVSAGNVRREHLREIWNTAEVFRVLRDAASLTGKCGLCEYRKVCMGCRARAFGETGDYLAEEPYCIYRPRGLRVD